MFYCIEGTRSEIECKIIELQHKPSKHFEVLFVTPRLFVNGVVHTYLFGYNFIDRDGNSPGWFRFKLR